MPPDPARGCGTPEQQRSGARRRFALTQQHRANALRLVRDAALRAEMGAASKALLARHFDVSAAARQILVAFGRAA